MKTGKIKAIFRSHKAVRGTCPFCGGQIILLKYYRPNETIKCYACGLAFPRSYTMYEKFKIRFTLILGWLIGIATGIVIGLLI